MDSIKNVQSDSSESSRDSCKLFIGGLSGKTTPDMLRDYFGQFGLITECTVMKDPVTRRSRGFGFVTFTNPSSVDSVLASGPHELDAKSVDPKPAVPKQSAALLTSNQTKTSNHHSRKLFVGGLSAVTTIEDVRRYFEQYGKVVDAMLLMDRLTQRHRGFAFVTFESEAVVERVLEVHFHEINNKMVECKKAKPKEELSPPPSRAGYMRRGDMATYVLPSPPTAGYYIHSYPAGYAPATALLSGALPSAAYLSAGLDPLSAAYSAALLPSAMNALSLDSSLGAGNGTGTDGSSSDVANTPTPTGLEPNGAGPALYSPPSYVMTSGGLLVNPSLFSLATPYNYIANVPQLPVALNDGVTAARPYRNGYC